MGTGIGKRGGIGKNNLTSKIVTVLADSDEVKPKNQMNKASTMFLQILALVKRTSNPNVSM